MTHLFLALTNPLEGKEPAFNAWYDRHHVREVLKYGRGFSAARRFRLETAWGPPTAPRWRYVAVYALEIDDLADYHADAWIPNRPALTPFTGLLADDHVAWVYTPQTTAPHHPTFEALTSGPLLCTFAREAPQGSSTTQGLTYVASPHQRTHQPPLPWAHLSIVPSPTPQVLAAPPAGEVSWLFEPAAPYLTRADA